MLLILQYLLCGTLLGSSFLLGFLLTGIFIYKAPEEIIEDNELHLNSFLEELEYEPMSNLSESDLNCLKDSDVIMSLEPLLKQTIRMYYEHNDKTFYYYSERETIYKYLEIVARYYILQYHCKQIFLELDETKETTTSEPILDKTGPFMVKNNSKKRLLEKRFIRFVYKGNENDYLMKKNKPTTNDINILDFLKLKEMNDSDNDKEYENIMKED